MLFYTFKKTPYEIFLKVYDKFWVIHNHTSSKKDKRFDLMPIFFHSEGFSCHLHKKKPDENDFYKLFAVIKVYTSL